MATASFSHRFDLGAVQAMLTSPQGGVVKDLLRRGLLVETQAKRNLGGIGGPKRIDTGRLRASIATQLVNRNGTPAILVGSNVYYAKWIHDGTGLFGPRHHRIVPVRAKFLRFRPKGSRKFIYRRSVAGIKPNPFLRNALAAARG
jgi:hypothetical protein